MQDEDLLWEKVIREFPDNPTLQEIHYARLKIREETRGMTSAEYVKYIKDKARELMEDKRVS